MSRWSGSGFVTPGPGMTITITLQHYNNNHGAAGSNDPVVPRAGYGAMIDRTGNRSRRENHNNTERKRPTKCLQQTYADPS